MIKLHKLQRFIINLSIPPRFLSDFDRDAGIVNPSYEAWEVQDQTLLAWLQTTLSKSILSRVLGCVHSYQVWDKIHDYFHTQTNARTHQLCAELRSSMLETKSICEFLNHIKSIVDELAGIGNPVQREEYVDAILEGLPQEFASAISVIESKFDSPSIAEIEALLLAHESHTNRYRKQNLNSSLLYSNATPNPNSIEFGTICGYVNYAGGSFRNFNGRRGSSDRSGSGRGGIRRFTNFQCQICLKFSHTANICHFRTDTAFQPHESMVLYDPTTLQPIQFNAPRSSNTWTNSGARANTWVNPATQPPSSTMNGTVPSAMLTNTGSQSNGNTTWILDFGASFHITSDS